MENLQDMIRKIIKYQHFLFGSIKKVPECLKRLNLKNNVCKDKVQRFKKSNKLQSLRSK